MDLYSLSAQQRCSVCLPGHVEHCWCCTQADKLKNIGKNHNLSYWSQSSRLMWHRINANSNHPVNHCPFHQITELFLRNYIYDAYVLLSPNSINHLLWSKVDIWNVNCVQTTPFIFDTQTGVLAKVSKFLKQIMSRPERDLNLQSSDSCRML